MALGEEVSKEDANDPDIGRVAKFCGGGAAKPPELGAIGRFLQTVAHSKRRVDRSPTLRAFKELLSQWRGSAWLVADDGAVTAFRELTDRYRNRAAHTSEISEEDFDACRNFVAGPEGVLWKLLRSTE